MRTQYLQLAFAVGVTSQINLGDIISAEQSIQSVATANIGGIATIAQSALSAVQSPNTQSSTQSRASQTSTSSSASPKQSTSTPSVTSASSSNSILSSSSSTSTSSSSTLTSSPSSTTQTRSSPSSLSPSSTSIPAPAGAAAATSPTSSSDPTKNGSHKTNTLLEIILPTVLSGLTLLVLLGLVTWYCLKRRNRRNRNSGMSHLYAAGSTVGGRDSPASMEERADAASLLPGATSPPLAPTQAHNNGHGVAYVVPDGPGAPAYSIREQQSRPNSFYPATNSSGHPSRLSASNSTNGASFMAPSSGSGNSSAARYMKGPRHSYLPVTTEDGPAELSADYRNVDHSAHPAYSAHPIYQQHTAPTRARTPPLQAIFPFGGKSQARQPQNKPRVSGMHGRGMSLEGPNDFDFAFNDSSNHVATISEHPAEDTVPNTTQRNRYSIPRKPVPIS